MKLTRHNGRSGRHGTYNPRHNDRRFDVENSEHIDAERARRNVYWDCYRGFTTHEFRENRSSGKFSALKKIERMLLLRALRRPCGEARNARNARKPRTRSATVTVEDLLNKQQDLPEESIYQIGTMGGESDLRRTALFSILSMSSMRIFERRFRFHITHLRLERSMLGRGDAPHNHERHVFDCERHRYGETSDPAAGKQDAGGKDTGLSLSPTSEKKTPKGR